VTVLCQPTPIFRASRGCVPSPCACRRDTAGLPCPCLPAHSVRKLRGLSPLAFPAQIKGRTRCSGFASVPEGLPVSACCNLNQLLPFCMGSLEAMGGKGSRCPGSPSITGTAAARRTHP